VSALPIVTILAANAIMAVGSAFQAAVGMGLALLVVPLLALLNPSLLPGPMLFAAIGLCFGMAWRDRASLDRRALAIGSVGLAAGTALGATALLAVPMTALPRLFGAMILCAVAVSLLGRKVRVGRGALLLGGVASGVMGTMAGIHGPPLALVLQHESPDRVRALLGAYFAGGYVISVLALSAAGRFGVEGLTLGLSLMPGTAVGFAVAPLVSHRLRPHWLRWVLLTVSTVSAGVLLVRG
jgi:uncharacterized membrane protein YfcA